MVCTKEVFIQIYFILQFPFYYHYSPKYTFVFKSSEDVWQKHPLHVNYISHCLPISFLFCLQLKSQGMGCRIVTNAEAVTSCPVPGHSICKNKMPLSPQRGGEFYFHYFCVLKYTDIFPQRIILKCGMGLGLERELSGKSSCCSGRGPEFGSQHPY